VRKYSKIFGRRLIKFLPCNSIKIPANPAHTTFLVSKTHHGTHGNRL
jgi:hypothetical protein